MLGLLASSSTNTSQYSALYALAPEGIGTAYVESLTRYTVRLAQAHGILLGDLLVHMVFPLTKRLRLQRQTALTSFWMKEARALNSTKGWASDWVDILQKLTQLDNLRWLTMLPWDNILHQTGLIRQSLAWCPSCYETWRQQKSIVYDPLLWSLAVVAVCPIHACPLQIHCPFCQKQQPHLSYNALPGHCYQCRAWLGELSLQSTDTWNPNAIDRWRAEAAGILLGIAPHLDEDFRRENFASRISELIAAEADGRLLEIERRTGITRTTVRGWQRGTVVPQLGPLLTFCRCMGVQPLSLLVDHAPNHKVSLPSDRQPPVRVERIYRKIDAEVLQSTLQQIAASKEDPPPSMREIGRRLGYDPRYLLAQFPAESKVISAGFLAFQRNQREQRLQEICTQVELVTRALHLQGTYPSEERVGAGLNKSGFMWEPEARQTWRVTLKKLGYYVGEGKIE